jgi:hypothetical protein
LLRTQKFKTVYDMENKTMKIKWINHMLNFVVIMALMLAWQPTTSAIAKSVPVTQAAQILPVENLLNSDGTLNSRTGARGALDLRGWNVTLDSARGPILTHDTAAPAAASADTWLGLTHNGLSGHMVYALAVVGSDLYVGGWFTQTSDGGVTNLNNIAKYSGGNWSALTQNGLDGNVSALAVIGSDLYVGGWFTQTFDGGVTNLGNIARYSASGTWSALDHNGLDGPVSALAVMGSDLYAGGSFSQTGDGTVKNLKNIARYSGGVWAGLAHNGLSSTVYVLGVIGSDLYAGGNFTQTADGTVKNLICIARYSGGEWFSLANNGLNSYVRAFAVIGSDLYVGGAFTQSADGTVKNLNYVARYSGGAWSTLTNNGLDGWVYALAASGSDLYVGGTFTKTKDGTVTQLNNIARYSGGSTWIALEHNGLNKTVEALAVSGSSLYVGGAFSQTNDAMVPNLNFIAWFGAPAAPGYSCYLPSVMR